MTSNSSSIDPVRRSVVVPGTPEETFDLFTQRFGDFKPPEHNLLSVPIAETVVDLAPGGGITDRGIDGSECRWARVLTVERPERVVFSWDISPTWEIESDPDRASEVEVRFEPDGGSHTRVEIEHRNLDRHGPGGEPLHDALNGDAGWPLYLNRFVGLATAP